MVLLMDRRDRGRQNDRRAEESLSKGAAIAGSRTWKQQNLAACRLTACLDQPHARWMVSSSRADCCPARWSRAYHRAITVPEDRFAEAKAWL